MTNVLTFDGFRRQWSGQSSASAASPVPSPGLRFCAANTWSGSAPAGIQPVSVTRTACGAGSKRRSRCGRAHGTEPDLPLVIERQSGRALAPADLFRLGVTWPPARSQFAALAAVACFGRRGSLLRVGEGQVRRRGCLRCCAGGQLRPKVAKRTVGPVIETEVEPYAG